MKSSILKIILITAASLGLEMTAAAATDDASTTYKAAEEQAAANYKIDQAKCDTLKDYAKDVCSAEAKAARVHIEANANAIYKNTVSARTSARKDIAKADYEVAKEKCGNLTGNSKDVCIKQAKANETTSLADAKADKKVTEARTDANDDKRAANFKVATEKCEALAGNAKDTCISSAKTQFGK